MPRRHDKVEIRDHRSVGVVGEGHVLEAHFALRRREGAVPADDPRFGVEHVEDPVRRRHRPVVEVDGLAEPGERPQQPLGEEDHHPV